MTCILSGANLNSGIAWIHPLSESDEDNNTYVSKYVPALYNNYNCKIDVETCRYDWTNEYWNIRNSFFTNLDVVTDNRWEEFPVKYTDGKRPFYYVHELKNSEKLTISFSIRVEKEAHIFLCNGKDPPKSNCYWILLGGFGGQLIVIRKCMEYEIRNYFDSPSYTSICRQQQKSLNRSADTYLNTDSWKHFTITINENNIVLKSVSNNEVLLDYTDNAGSHININHLIVRSYKYVTAYWKFHNYNFTYSTTATKVKLGPRINIPDNTLCISLYAAMCSGCILIINAFNIIDNANISKKIVAPLNEYSWTEVKWNISFLTNELDIEFYVETSCTNNCDQQFWAIDNFRICTDNEVRVLNVEGDPLKSSFQIVDSSFKNLFIKSLTLPPSNEVQHRKCPVKTIDSATCTTCIQVFGSAKQFCENSTICNYLSNEEGICSCSPGFTGGACNKYCPAGFYGIDCKEKCGLCRNILPCHFATGDCIPKSMSCLSNFTGRQCKTPPYPVLMNAPNVISISKSYVTIQINNFSYYGLGEPTTFKIRYEVTNDNSSWNETGLFSFYYANEITLHNLLPDTNYTIRVVLQTSEGQFYNGAAVPITYAKTHCVDIQQKDIDVQLSNTSAILTFENYFELCSLKYYEIICNNAVLEENDNQFYIRDLDPNTNYTLSIKNLKTSAVMYHTFRTKEGVASTALNMTIISSTATSLTISWEKPNQPHGQIKHYEINYKHHRYLACDDNDISNENTVSLQHQSTSITLKNLRPYSEYIINVAAFTVVVGKFAEIPGITSPTDDIDKSEIPSNVSVQPSYDEAMITLKQPNCSCIKGDIAYYISARCRSDWCLNKTATLNRFYHDSYRGGLKLTGLAPYSEYIMDIKVGRRNGNEHEMEELTQYPFKTTSTVPYSAKFDIYEESENILRLRIVPPYPPTGELEKYFLRYYAAYYDTYVTEKDFDPVSCKIWTKYHCIDITKNLRKDTLYRVHVQAGNKNITELGPTTSDSEYTTQRISYKPEEVRYSWDNYYNLTLQWNHPNITNGPLTKFRIIISKGREECYSYNYMVREETTNLTYNHTVSMENKNCYTSELAVDIAGYNIRKGDSGTINIYSPPETPALNREPFAATVSNITITIAISAKMIEFPKSFMYILLSQSKSKFEIDNSNDFLDKLESLETLRNSGFIRKYNLNIEIPMAQLTIGHNKSDSLQNDPGSVRATLMPNTSYTITILLYNEYQGRKRYRVYEIVKSTTGISISPDSSSNHAIFSVILVFLILPLFWIYYRKHKTGKWCSIINNRRSIPNNRRNPNGIPLKETLVMAASQNRGAQISPMNVANNLNLNKINNVTDSNTFSKIIKVIDFDKYVKEAILNGELERQHSLFLHVQNKPLDYGYVLPNDWKNGITDYDQTENEYEEIIDDQYSDAMTANYIQGYKSKTAFIAIKSPTVASFNSFWKSIWQNNVKHIVMLSNGIEVRKEKHIQYWPSINEVKQFGNILVKYISTAIFADYEYRTFLVSSNNIERLVEQLHFTSWPDYGVPMYPKCLVPLFKILLAIPEGNSPIVVHCSVGMEPIGTVILCDLCLKMAMNEDIIDILKYRRQIKAQRANLIGSFDQYKLVHLVLLEYLINPDTSITCDKDAVNNILNLFETPMLENQFQCIGKIAWQDQAMRPLLDKSKNPECMQKNRVQNILANGHGRIYLSLYPVTDQHSNYINAVEVDGFKSPKRFIVTQQPLPNTISDFWRMIDENKVSTIVSLNTIEKENNRSCVFWPTFSINNIHPVPYLLIKFVNKINNEEFTIVKLELHNSRNEVHLKRDICLLHFKNWPVNQLTPNSNESLLKLWNEVQKLSQTKHPIVVTCYDGATASGLFIAFTFVIEKMKLEHQCDVCLAVRTIRHNREQFVSKLEQFKYLYHAVIAYLTPGQLYANISSLRP